jgi:hypothetical protein
MSTQSQSTDEWQVLGQLERAVDALCSNEHASIAGAVATLTVLARRHPALVMLYRRTIICVARVRANLAEGPALANLLGTLGLSDQGGGSALRS